MLLSALLASHSSFATSCYEESPNYVLLGDKYYDLDNSKPLTADDKKRINVIVKNLAGNWKGTGSTFQCIGSELNPAVKNEPLILTAKLSTNSSNELHIDIEKYHVDEKFKSDEHPFYFGNANSYQSVSVTANKIVIEERLRHAIMQVKSNIGKKDQKNFNQFYEMLHSIEHGEKHFNYTLRKYINGRLAIEERWKLVRD